MPHSTLSDSSVLHSPVAGNDMLPDAPPPSLVNLSEMEGSDSGDVTKIEYSAKSTQKSETRLEDLFNEDDDEEDEEFPSSRMQDEKVDSSPPKAPM